MAGFDNEVMFALGERLEVSTAQAIELMQQTSTDVSKVNFTGDPNGSVSANASSICHDPVSGDLWLKSSGTGNTGWSKLSGGSTINGDIGSITGSNVTIYANNAANGTGGSVLFDNSGPISTLKLMDANRNLFLGQGAGVSGVLSQFNTALGGFALAGITDSTGGSNIAIGDTALISLNNGPGGNTAVGSGSLFNLIDGASNTCIGRGAGSNYAGSESSNICIANTGLTGDNNVIRIGELASIQQTFIAGITGVTVSSSAVVGVDSNGQLSSLGTGAIGQVLTSTGTGSPTFQNPITSNTRNSFIDQASAISLTTGTAADITSISIDAGTWIISGLVEFGGTPTISGAQDISISTTSATHGTLGDNSSQSVYLSGSFLSGNCLLTIPTYILSVAVTTTVYLVASGAFSAGSMTAYGRITAIKIA